MWITNVFNNFYVENQYVKENEFISGKVTHIDIPDFEEIRHKLPQPIWEGHDDYVACYWKTWELAFKNLHNPTPENGFVSPYIDTAFNDNLFMWDSAFILMFARYGHRVVNFQQTLDNFYAKQHHDGYICREIHESNGADCFHRFDPSGTGPNIMPWTEWEYYLNYGDKARLARVFPPLLAYYQWFRTNRTWPDGTYWATGWSCGMDNQPRVCPPHHTGCSHAHQAWVDTCLQQIFVARILHQMAVVLGRTEDVQDLSAEANTLSYIVNDLMWDDDTAFYYDLTAKRRFVPVKAIGAYWSLLAGIVPPEWLPRFLAHLENEREFKRPHRIPTLSADHPEYSEDGGYWLGGVWAPTNYMVLRGLRNVGADQLAHEIALNHVSNVVQVFNETGTVWENYAPERVSPGNPAKGDFVGWTGLSSIAIPFEYVFGLTPIVPENKLVWDVRLTEKHGVLQYPFASDGLIDLTCERRNSPNEQPVLAIRSNIPFTLELRWGDQQELVEVAPTA